ncbi:protein of unknown function [Brochothrix thermosphacta]|nr:protein of unknown function [Brochothrix thermosphacta]
MSTNPLLLSLRIAFIVADLSAYENSMGAVIVASLFAYENSMGRKL